MAALRAVQYHLSSSAFNNRRSQLFFSLFESLFARFIQSFQGNRNSSKYPIFAILLQMHTTELKTTFSLRCFSGSIFDWHMLLVVLCIPAPLYSTAYVSTSDLLIGEAPFWGRYELPSTSKCRKSPMASSFLSLLGVSHYYWRICNCILQCTKFSKKT